MIPRFNLHTHTTYCDGKSSAEEMVLSAIKLGCEGIGFSGHSYIASAPDWTMSPEGTEKYISEIKFLREKYADHIEILLGIEHDVLSEIDRTSYDYIIGAVHRSPSGGFDVDHTVSVLTEMVNEHFGGDFYAFAADYYRGLSEIKEKTDCDIVAHFDLITKFNEDGSLFDENDRRYRDAAFTCLDVLKEKDVIFEINTGAISRGYRKSPYPSKAMLSRMAELGCKLTLTTDCHHADWILCAYDDAVEYARECGVRELYFPRNKEFVPYKI